MTRQNGHLGKGWKKVLRQSVVVGHRKGWGGVWDHFVAVLRKNPLHFISYPVEVSFFVQSEKQVVVRVTQAQVEFFGKGEEILTEHVPGEEK